jgi:phage tail sheath protein FI
MTAVDLPAYRVVAPRPPAAEEELRNDVAGFLGPSARGPLVQPVRVTGPQQLGVVFGAGAATVRAVQAYFANGGEVAWVVRVGAGGTAARAEIDLGSTTAGAWDDDGPTRMSLPGTRLRLEASSRGAWGDRLTVELTYRAYGLGGAPEVDVAVLLAGEAPAYQVGLAPDGIVPALAGSGRVLARLEGPPAAADPGASNRGPASLRWSANLTGGTDPVATTAAYLEAVLAIGDVGEVALVAAPTLDELGAGEDERVVIALAAEAAAAQDRLVVLAAPEVATAEVPAWTARMRSAVGDPGQQRALAAYHPWLLSEDPAPTTVDRYRPTTPVGHVCGMISRLDRERGSGWSPANELVRDAIDVTRRTTPAEQASVIRDQVNLLRCRVGGGLELWGARTLDQGDGRFIAHRRIVHRLVRAMRRVAEPLVFDTNGPELWFTVVRALSGVLLEAFRSGALMGDTPDQAYRVRCDETTNPPAAVEQGRVVCEVELAPAAPMEFITLRVTLGPEGLLEVVETGGTA